MQRTSNHSNYPWLSVGFLACSCNWTARIKPYNPWPSHTATQAPCQILVGRLCVPLPYGHEVQQQIPRRPQTGNQIRVGFGNVKPQVTWRQILRRAGLSRICRFMAFFLIHSHHVVAFLVQGQNLKLEWGQKNAWVILQNFARSSFGNLDVVENQGASLASNSFSELSAGVYQAQSCLLNSLIVKTCFVDRTIDSTPKVRLLVE